MSYSRLSEMYASTPITQADLDEARAEGHAAGLAEGKRLGHEPGKAEGVPIGAAAERERINAIFSMKEAEGREATARHFALKTDLSLDGVKVAIAGVPKVGGHSSGTYGLAPSQAGAVPWSEIAAIVSPLTRR
ncbi:hypothetical protein [Beijerinckia indica]|uniref:Uncharacterized protein n=1 Tax=Beijerinckia indica subsp. indica (strain ATCC 9039 / DSM 1715 / NCIMB 8712) TaxID=395963 RepID=B2ICD5_BEII9|nr:hypothetical protein [Beijerinckia indica]ACB96732.1 hypothetical protein Bind_3172 [Beijerinckia indica subsp. indica ATCC 9039]